MVKTNPIVIFRLPMIPADHFHPSAGLFEILRKSVIWPLPPVNFVIPSLIRTSWDTAEVSVSLFGAPKHLWFSILVGAIHGFHNGSVDHSHRNSARWNCILGNHEKLYRSESFPGYLSKLEFKYLEIEVFRCNSCYSSDFRNVWLYTFPQKYRLKSVSEFNFLEIRFMYQLSFFW